MRSFGIFDAERVITMKEIKKRLVSSLLSSVLLINTISVPVMAEEENQVSVTENLSIEEIKEVIECFFTEYEKAFDLSNANANSYKNCFVKNKTSETNVNLALIDAVLSQRITSALNHIGGAIIKEENKKLLFDYSNIVISNSSATIEVSVTKQFNYNICSDIESESQNLYSIELVKENAEWKILAIHGFLAEDIKTSLEEQGVDLENIASINAYKNGILNNILINNSKLSHSGDNHEIGLITRAASTYNANGAATYANTYALSPNPNYFNLESIGGDCTNFASQVLHEGGGIPMHYGASGYNTSWFYTSPSNRSTSWAGAQYLYDYMHSDYSKINWTASSWSSISNGDLIQVGTPTNIYHSMIVTGIVYSSSGRRDLLVTYRSSEGNHQKSILLSTRPSGETRQYIHILGGK